MVELHELVKSVIEELIAIQNKPQLQCRGDDPLPRMLGNGEGGLIRISKNIDQLIIDFARRKIKIDPAVQSRFIDKDFRDMARRAFGPALSEIELEEDIDQNATLVMRAVEESIAREVEWVSEKGQREIAFGCTLFSYDDIAPFEIGPVRFEPRKIWLDRKASDGRWVQVEHDGHLKHFSHRIADGPISKTTRRRITQIWLGRKLRKRKPSADNHDEQYILDFIGNCTYVCSIKVPGFGYKAGQDKAVMAARLALAAVSLLWERSSSAMQGFNLFDGRESRNHTVLSFTGDGLMLQGDVGAWRPHAPWAERDQLEGAFTKYRDCFAIAGEAISAFLDPEGCTSRPKLMNAIVHSLLWFYEGCLESVDQIAIVKFSSAMEVLTGSLSRNGSQEALRKLINASLGIADDAVITRDGLTLEKVIQFIYGKGRTRMIHGENHALGQDWSVWRASAEKLARSCIVLYTSQAAENPSIVDPKMLLREMSNR